MNERPGHNRLCVYRPTRRAVTGEPGVYNYQRTVYFAIIGPDIDQINKHIFRVSYAVPGNPANLPNDHIVRYSSVRRVFKFSPINVCCKDIIRNYRKKLKNTSGGTNIMAALTQALASIADAQRRNGEALAIAKLL